MVADSPITGVRIRIERSGRLVTLTPSFAGKRLASVTCSHSIPTEVQSALASLRTMVPTITETELVDVHAKILELGGPRWTEPQESGPNNESARLLPYEPPPIDVLPGPARALVEAAARAIDCDPGFVMAPVLATMSAAIGASRGLQLRPGQIESALVWTCVIAESGTGKTPALQFATGPIRARERRARAEWKRATQEHELLCLKWDRSRREGGAASVRPDRPPEPRWYTSDATIEKVGVMLEQTPRGFLLARDELAGWFAFDRYAKSKGAEQPAWLSIHSGQTLAVDRKDGTRILVERPFVAIAGGVQPRVLRAIIAAEPSLLDAGLLGRVLLVQPPTWARTWNEDGVPEKVQREWGSFVDALCDLDMDENGPGPVIVGMTEAAKIVWCEWFARAQDGLQTSPAASQRASWAKIETAAARLALIVHEGRRVLDRTLGATVDAESMRAGVRLAEWFGKESARVYGMLGSEEATQLAELHERVRRAGPGGITANAWAKRTQRGDRRNTAAAEAELERLVKAGVGRWVDTPEGQGGRRSRRLVLVPPVPEPPEPPEPSRACDSGEATGGFGETGTGGTNAWALPSTDSSEGVNAPGMDL